MRYFDNPSAVYFWGFVATSLLVSLLGFWLARRSNKKIMISFSQGLDDVLLILVISHIVGAIIILFFEEKSLVNYYLVVLFVSLLLFLGQYGIH